MNKAPSLVTDKSLEEMHSITLAKKEWLVIFNVIVRGQYSIPDAMLVKPIADKLHHIVAATDSDKVVLKKE